MSFPTAGAAVTRQNNPCPLDGCPTAYTLFPIPPFPFPFSTLDFSLLFQVLFVFGYLKKVFKLSFSFDVKT
jgi:hypothetical protein